MRLMAGVYASVRERQWVRVWEEPDGIALSYPQTSRPVMTPDEARCLAAQLLMAADRLENGDAQ